MTIAGQCRCGACRYEIDLADLPPVYACHCHICQRVSGSAFSVQALVAEDKLSVAGPIIVLASMNLPVVITFEASLSFLGFGVQPPKSSLGTLIKDGFVSINQSWWPTIAAAVVLAIATLGATLLGEALRRVIDPKAAGVR